MYDPAQDTLSSFKQAEEEGKSAFLTGESKETNPYGVLQPNHAEKWVEGYLKAEKESQDDPEIVGHWAIFNEGKGKK